MANNKNKYFMAKVINFKESSFDLVYGIIKEQVIKAYSNLSDDFKKHLLTPSNVKVLENIESVEPRSYCPYIIRSEDVRILPIITLGMTTLCICCSINAYYVPGYPIPGQLKVKGLMIETPHYFNSWNQESYALRFFTSIALAVKEEIES
ncbi:hypothetical protein IKN40_03485 [bacterium]|nr:hypothetical protein [bacterium]